MVVFLEEYYVSMSVVEDVDNINNIINKMYDYHKEMKTRTKSARSTG